FETEGYVHGTPAIVDNLVAASGCDGYLRIINTQDGVENCRILLGDYVIASPAIYSHNAYMGTYGNQVIAVDLKAGKILWRYEHPVRQFPFYASAAVTENVVIVGGRDKIVHALQPKSGNLIWTYATKSQIESSPVIVDDRVIFGTSAGNLYALAIDSGKPVWKFTIGSPITASPSVASGKLVIGATNGVLYCFGEK
ncbi:TPA: serine/threonine protein kinase, partial [Candidatus Poribacteria bacterium]|nr:serine/threonine protein kinase [Candidatus Poribacteria bacterium]